jgi:hypothetical protein
MVGVGTLPPVIALAAWTMVMWAWMYWTRMPEMSRAKLSEADLSTLNQAKLDALLPPHVQWKAYNYNHLHEAPTVFYAVALVLALVGQGDGVSALLAWIYVALRIVHSLIQATTNRVMRRFAVFAVSSVVLMALIVRAAIALV